MNNTPIYSKSGNYLIVIDKIDSDMVAARVFKKIRSYWEPVAWETNMTIEKLEEFKDG